MIDSVAPVITLSSFNSNFMSGRVFQAGSTLTLAFSVIDDYDLPTQVNNAVPGMVVTIGSAPATFVSSSGTTGNSRNFQFSWTVPASPPSTVGFQVTVLDTAGNSKTLSADAWLTSGRHCMLC